MFYLTNSKLDNNAIYGTIEIYEVSAGAVEHTLIPLFCRVKDDGYDYTTCAAFGWIKACTIAVSESVEELMQAAALECLS